MGNDNYNYPKPPYVKMKKEPEDNTTIHKEWAVHKLEKAAQWYQDKLKGPDSDQYLFDGVSYDIETPTESWWKSQFNPKTNWSDSSILKAMEKEGHLKQIKMDSMEVPLDYKKNPHIWKGWIEPSPGYFKKTDESGTWTSITWSTDPTAKPKKLKEPFTEASSDGINWGSKKAYKLAKKKNKGALVTENTDQTSGAAGDYIYFTSGSAPPGPVMWNMKQARAIVRDLQEWSRQFNYHVCLGGGVLNKGESSKDLDIYFLPFNEKGRKPAEMLEALQHRFQAPLERLGNDYPEKAVPYIFKGKLIYQGESPFQLFSHTQTKRIDFFVLGTEAEALALSEDSSFLLTHEDFTAQHIEIEPSNIVHFKKVKHVKN